MPEQRRLTDYYSWEMLAEVLVSGKICYYRIDSDNSRPKWVPAYLVGIDYNPNGYLEVLPQKGTPFADKWYEENKPTFNFFPDIIKDPQPIPIKVTDFSRMRIPTE